MARRYVANTHWNGPIRLFGHNSAHKEVSDGLSPFYPRLWRFCLVLTRNRDRADDLAQATCARALANSDKFTPGTDLDRWLFTMARRAFLNDQRAAAVRQGQGLVPVEETDLNDEKPSMETNILAREVFNLVQALPEAQRVTAVMVYVEGYSYRETAEFLDVPIGTVMSRLSTVRQTIARQTQTTSQRNPS